jgi:MFS family permease
MQEAHDPYAALRQPNYLRLLGGGIFASLGAEMQLVAVYWEIYQRTHSPGHLGLVGLVQFLPILCLALPAGHAADRWNRKYLLLVALTIMTVASLSLAAVSLNQAPLPLMYASLILAGVGRAFSIPARWSLLPQVVPAHLLSNAVTWNSSGWQLATISGPALGGLVIARFDPLGAYLGTALFLGIGMISVSTIRMPTRPLAPGGDGAQPAPAHPWYAGAKFIWQTKPILATITLDLFAVLLGGATALLPVFAVKILEVGPTGMGLLRTAPSAGALTMALTLAHSPPLRRPGVTLLLAVAGFGIATIIFGFSKNYMLSWAALALTGALDNISVVVRGTLIQTMTPDALRGRVAAVNAVFISSSNELGALESGVVAEFVGPVYSVVLGGIGTLFVVAVSMALWPELTRLTSRPTVAAKPMEGSDGGDAAIANPAQ